MALVAKLVWCWKPFACTCQHFRHACRSNAMELRLAMFCGNAMRGKHSGKGIGIAIWDVDVWKLFLFWRAGLQNHFWFTNKVALCSHVNFTVIWEVWNGFVLATLQSRVSFLKLHVAVVSRGQHKNVNKSTCYEKCCASLNMFETSFAKQIIAKRCETKHLHLVSCAQRPGLWWIVRIATVISAWLAGWTTNHPKALTLTGSANWWRPSRVLWELQPVANGFSIEGLRFCRDGGEIGGPMERLF